jgi:hypothetical protein
MVDAPFSLLGAGDILLDILDLAGESTGLQLKGDCSLFNYKADSEVKQSTKHGRDNYGQVGASASLPKPSELDFTMDEVDMELLAAASNGTAAAYTQSSGTMPATDVTTIADRFVEVGKRRISAVIVTNPGATTTYVVDVDYTINPRLGMIMALSTGNIPSGEVVKFSCSYAAINGTRIAGMTKSQVLARVMVDGVDFNTRRDFIFDAGKVRLSVTSSVPVKGSDFMKVQFKGVMETPAGSNAPFVFDWLS